MKMKMRQRDRQKETDRKTEIDRLERMRHTEYETERQREREGERQRETERQRESPLGSWVIPELVMRLLDFPGNLLPVLGTELGVIKLRDGGH